MYVEHIFLWGSGGVLRQESLGFWTAWERFWRIFGVKLKQPGGKFLSFKVVHSYACILHTYRYQNFNQPTVRVVWVRGNSSDPMMSGRLGIEISSRRAAIPAVARGTYDRTHVCSHLQAYTPRFCLLTYVRARLHNYYGLGHIYC